MYALLREGTKEIRYTELTPSNVHRMRVDVGRGLSEVL